MTGRRDDGPDDPAGAYAPPPDHAAPAAFAVPLTRDEARAELARFARYAAELREGRRPRHGQ